MTNKKKIGVQRKLLRAIIPALAIGVFIIIFMATRASKDIIKTKTIALMESESMTSVNQIDAWQNDVISTLETAVGTMEYMGYGYDQILKYEEKYLETYEDFPNGIYIATENNNLIDASGWEPDEDLRETSWYNEGLAHPNGFVFGAPYIDEYTGTYIVSATRTMNIDGELAVAAADVGLTILNDVVGQMEVVGDGDAFIIDSETATILADVTGELAGKTVSECGDALYSNIYNDIMAGSLDTKTYASNAGKCMIAIKPIKDTQWFIISRALEKNIYADINILQIILAVIGIVVLVIISVIMILVIRSVTRPIEKLTETITKITDGNFTTDVQVNGNDEVAIMAGNMKEFLVTMRGILGSIVNISNNIDDQAKTSNVVSNDLYESANGQADAMGQMLEALEELVKSISVIADNATTLAAVVAETNDSGIEALNNISETITIAKEGKENMQAVTVSMSDAKDGMAALEESIQAVGDVAIKIDEITTTISSIADETNLLALNASIEAARAGEAGRGFAVVATEIKKLAETSSEAALEISSLINSVTSQINETVKQSEKSMDQISSSVDSVYVAADKFNSIYESIELTNNIVEDIIEQIKNVNDVSSTMAAITEEQSASAEEIEATAVSIRELADTVSENSASVNDDAKELADTATTLKEHISKFTI